MSNQDERIAEAKKTLRKARLMLFVKRSFATVQWAVLVFGFFEIGGLVGAIGKAMLHTGPWKEVPVEAMNLLTIAGVLYVVKMASDRYTQWYQQEAIRLCIGTLERGEGFVKEFAEKHGGQKK